MGAHTAKQTPGEARKIKATSGAVTRRRSIWTISGERRAALVPVGGPWTRLGDSKAGRDETARRFCAFLWPNHVREFPTVMEGAAVLCENGLVDEKMQHQKNEL